MQIHERLVHQHLDLVLQNAQCTKSSILVHNLTAADLADYRPVRSMLRKCARVEVYDAIRNILLGQVQVQVQLGLAQGLKGFLGLVNTKILAL